MKMLSCSLSCCALLLGCPDVEKPDDNINANEVITTVELTFTPVGGGEALVFKHADKENDGDPVIDPVVLPRGAWAMGVRFLNELEDPAEDITIEIKDEESDEHQVLVYGSGVASPATGDDAAALVAVAYDDADDNGFPLGIAHTVDAATAGVAELNLMLRHLPPENGTAVKNGAVAADFAAGGSGAIGGEVDADVVFPLIVP